MKHSQPKLHAMPSITSKVETDLQLRESNHRWLNDLQLITSMLSLQAKRAQSNEVREALRDIADRVSILARSRASLQNPRYQSLDDALRQICEALQSQASARGIIMSLDVQQPIPRLSHDNVTTLALIVNELATNAIKHAFLDRESGRVKVAVKQQDERYMLITVEDDGIPFRTAGEIEREGFGMSLVRKLVESIDGIVIRLDNSKCYQIRVPHVQNGRIAK